jgi:hypothetical protein
MDNRPIALKEPIIAFKNSDLTIKLNYPEGYTMPAEIEMELWVGSIKAQIESPVIAEITGESAEISVDRSVVKTLPSQADAYFLHDGNFLFGAKFFVQSGLAENTDPIEMNVSFNGDQVIVVEVMGMDLVTEQVNIATEKAEEATQGATTATTQAGIATTGANLATTKAGEAAGSATAAVNAETGAVNAQQGAEAARDVAIAVSVEKIYVATYAEAVPYFTGAKSREVYVEADETYYEGDPSWYKYDPQLGTALLGIDFNYTEE